MAGEVAQEPRKSGGFIGKIIAGVCTAVIAPIAVALGVKFLGPQVEKQPEKQVEKGIGNGVLDPIAGKLPHDPVIHLVDSGGWATYENNSGVFTRIKDVKAADKIFHNTAGVIHAMSGKMGSLVSDDSFENYMLTVEYKWGPAPPPPPKDKGPTAPMPTPKGTTPPTTPMPKGTTPPTPTPSPKDKVASKGSNPRKASMVLHAQDTTTQTTFMPGIRCLMVEGDVGSIQLRGDPGKVSVKAAVIDRSKGLKPSYAFRTDATPKLLTTLGKEWSGVIHRLGEISDAAEDDEGGKASDLERAGDWNKLEFTCDGNNLTIKLNDHEVLNCTATTPRHGRIVLMAEGFEVHFRKIDVLPLGKK